MSKLILPWKLPCKEIYIWAPSNVMLRANDSSSSLRRGRTESEKWENDSRVIAHGPSDRLGWTPLPPSPLLDSCERVMAIASSRPTQYPPNQSFPRIESIEKWRQRVKVIQSAAKTTSRSVLFSQIKIQVTIWYIFYAFLLDSMKNYC